MFATNPIHLQIRLEIGVACSDGGAAVSYAQGGSYGPSETLKCVFHQLSAKNYSRVPLMKLWNVIVSCHDCNCGMHLSIFSDADTRPPKKSS